MNKPSKSIARSKQYLFTNDKNTGTFKLTKNLSARRRMLTRGNVCDHKRKIKQLTHTWFGPRQAALRDSVL